MNGEGRHLRLSCEASAMQGFGDRLFGQKRGNSTALAKALGPGAHGACEGNWMLTCNCGVSIWD